MAIRGRGGGNASGGGSCGGGGAVASIPCWRSCCSLSRSTARRCSARRSGGQCRSPGSRRKARHSAGSQLGPNIQHMIPARRTRPLRLARRRALGGRPAQAAVASLVTLHREFVGNDHCRQLSPREALTSRDAWPELHAVAHQQTLALCTAALDHCKCECRQPGQPHSAHHTTLPVLLPRRSSMPLGSMFG